MAPRGPMFKTLMRMEDCARLEAMHLPDPDIAAHLNLTLGGLASLKNNPNYINVRRRVQMGVLSEFDREIATDRKYIQDKIKNHVPIALQAIIDNLSSPDPKVKQVAADDILDRDGIFAKVSRVGMPSEDQGGSNLPRDTSVADSLVAILNGINKGVVDNVSTTTNADNGKQASSGTDENASTSKDSTINSGRKQQGADTGFTEGFGFEERGSDGPEPCGAD